MNRCKTCKHWQRTEAKPWIEMTKGYLSGGFCLNESKWVEGAPFDEYPQDAMVYSYDEGGSFWTGPDFGCVHHET